MTALAPIRDAATVILLRRQAAEVLVLMGMRGAGAVFMPSKYVFPGGAVDADDATARLAAPLAEPHRARLVREPEFAHLQAIGYTVPGGDGGPTCVLLYLRDLAAITRIDVQQAGAEPIPFRLPTPAELATPVAGYNPFRAEASG